MSTIQNQKDPMQSLLEWSKEYSSALKKAGVDLNELTLVEDNWDTRFLFLATHCYIVRFSKAKHFDKTAREFCLPLYANLVLNTRDLLIQLGVKKEQALTFVPNLHVRLYDYLVYNIGALNGYKDSDLDEELMASWYSTTAQDLVDQNIYLESSPDDNDGYIKRGKARFDSKDYQGAIEDFSHILDSDSQNSEAYCYRAICHDRLDQNDSALADFSSAIEIKPTHIQALLLRAELRLTAFEDREGSISDYTKAIEVAPDNAKIYFKRATAYAPIWVGLNDLTIQDCSLAINDFLKACENDSGAGPLYGLRRVYELRGDLHFRGSLFNEAISDYGDAIQICDSRELFTKRGNAKKANGDINGACEDWKNVLNVERTKYDTDDSVAEETKEAIELLKCHGE